MPPTSVEDRIMHQPFTDSTEDGDIYHFSSQILSVATRAACGSGPCFLYSQEGWKVRRSVTCNGVNIPPISFRSLKRNGASRYKPRPHRVAQLDARDKRLRKIADGVLPVALGLFTVRGFLSRAVRQQIDDWRGIHGVRR